MIKDITENGNSVFVDENFNPYNNQWAFLSNVKLLSKHDILTFIKTLHSEETGGLYEGDIDKPWERKKIVNLSNADFPPTINIVSANMIYIEKSGISSKGLSHLKRLASFKNPDFYKSQAMRLSIYGKPRIISTAEDTGKYLALPRGLFDDIIQIFVNNNIDLNIRNKTNHGRNINVEFNGELRPEQSEAVEALINKDCGVLSASTAFGKTVVGAALIAERKVNALVLVHRTNLLKQ